MSLTRSTDTVERFEGRVESLRPFRDAADEEDVKARIDERIDELRRECEDDGQESPLSPPPLEVDGDVCTPK